MSEDPRPARTPSTRAALARLEPLVGVWDTEMSVQGTPVARNRVVHAWTEDGAFLRISAVVVPVEFEQPALWRENAPASTVSLVGLDGATDRFTMFYSDSRGVHRVYGLDVRDSAWRITGTAGPAFHQRFTGTIAGDTITSRWEASADGTDWRTDFDQVYTRVS